MEEFNYDLFFNQFLIEKGDIVDVASDLASILMYCRRKKISFDSNHMIDMLQQKAGNSGTVMIRTFSWDFCHGKKFDILKSPGRVGSLGNIAMNRADFKRTKHPLYSWMVWGKHQKELCSLENKTSFGVGTPFDFLYKHNGKQITIGNTSSVACTQVHHCEALARVPYRFEKNFTGIYADEWGRESEQTFSMYVKPYNAKVSNDVLNSEGYSKILVEEGILTNTYYNGILNCRTYNLHALTDYVLNDLTKGDGSLVVSVNENPGYKNIDINWADLAY